MAWLGSFNGHSYEHNTSRTPWGKFFRLGTLHYCRIRIWWWKVKCLGPWDLTIHILKCNISRTPWENLCIFWTNLHSDSESRLTDLSSVVKENTWYISNTRLEFHYMMHKNSLGLKDDLIRIWWLKVTVTSQNPFLPPEHVMLRTPRENPFKFGTNVHLESWIKWKDLSDQRSKIKITVTQDNKKQQQRQDELIRVQRLWWLHMSLEIH